jgi:hypothetical protein
MDSQRGFKKKRVDPGMNQSFRVAGACDALDRKNEFIFFEVLLFIPIIKYWTPKRINRSFILTGYYLLMHLSVYSFNSANVFISYLINKRTHFGQIE